MTIFSILLIENQVWVASTIVQEIEQHLADYRLIITREFTKAMAQPEPAQVILLNVAQLAGDVAQKLTLLSKVYPNTPVILLCDALTSRVAAEVEEHALLEALSGEISDYVTLSKAGLLALGKRLEKLQDLWLAQQRQAEAGLTSSELLYNAIVSDTSQLAIQLIGVDNHIHAWNRAAELLFGLKKQSLNGLWLESLPLSPSNLGRLKDFLAQVRTSGEALFIPNFSLENHQGETHWVQLHLYPIYAGSAEGELSDICIISADVTDLKRTEIQTWQYSQELQILLETSRQISGRLELLPTLEKIVEQTKTLLNADNGRIYFLEKDQQTMQPILSIGPLPDQDYPTAIPVGQGMIGAIAVTGQAVMRNFIGAPNKAHPQAKEHILGVPLAAFKEMMGVMVISRIDKTPFVEDDLRFLESIVRQVSSSIYNARRFEETRNYLNEIDALYQVASALASTQDAQTIMSTVLQEYLRALNLKQGSVIIFDFETKSGVVKVNFQDDLPTRPALSFSTGLEAERRPAQGLEGWQLRLRNNPVYEHLMATHHPLVINDTQTERLPFMRRSTSAPLSLIRLGWAGPETHSLLVIPIQIREEIVGALVVEATREKHIFTSGEIALGQAMADQLGIGLQNVELYEAEYRRRQQAETLREVSLVVGSSLNLNEVLERILDQLARVIKYDSAAIHLIEGQRRRIIAGRGFPNPKKIIGLTFPVKLDNENDPVTLAIQARQPLVVGNVPASYNVFKKSPQDHIKSWMGIPLIVRDKVIGLISIDHAEANAYDEDDLHLAMAFAHQVAVALENARLYEVEVRELERELEIAQTIQETLLPQLVPNVPGLEISGRILPARQIGGDFFHFFPVGKDQLGVAIGDVSGKGIPAALYMAVAITAIDAQIRADLGPGELLNKLNHILYNRLRENKMNVALQVATFAPLTGIAGDEDDQKPQGILMTVASAGMVAPVGATEHGCHFLPVSGLPVGALSPPEQTYHDDMFLLDPFTTIIFTSDGIVEAQNETRELFGFDRLEATINEVISTRDAEIIAEHIINTAQEFVGQAEQNDDMTVVVVVKT